MTIGKSLQTVPPIDYRFFSRISIATENTVLDSRNDCDAIVISATNTLIVGCKNTVIPNSITAIGQDAFNGCSELSSIEIPNSVITIGNSAFSNCIGLTGNLYLPNSVTTIGAYAFKDCCGFTGNLTIPNSVTSIGQGAFSNCNGLTGELIIPNSVTGIGSCAFESCTGLTGGLTIPNSVTSRTFYDCRGFNGNLTISNSVTSIGQGAFYNCSGFTGTLIIPNSVTTIDKEAFSGCTGFTGLLTIPNSVTEIGDGAFNYCSGLSEIYFNAENCGGRAWLGCSGITTIVIGDFVETIKANMFSWLENLTTISIGKSVRHIESGAFANNPRLNMVYYNVEKDLEAPTNVFDNCPNLTTIHIGPEVQEIGSNIFKGCNTVHFVVALGPTPAVLDAGAFSDIVDNSVLMVSCGKRVTYYSVWNMFPFNNIIEDCDTYGINVGAVGDGGTITPSVTEAQMGQEVQITITPNPGMVLVSIKVVNANDPTQIIPISPSGKAASTYSFTMPPFEVVVMATFKNSGTSVGENNSVEVAVYPNPTNGLVKIEAESIKHVSISNMLGQIVFDGKVGGDAFEYDFSGQKAGIYLVRIETASGVAVKKVSVTR